MQRTRDRLRTEPSYFGISDPTADVYRLKSPGSKELVVQEATSLHEREAIYRFRYDIYIKEMKRNCQADHQLSRIEDPIDDRSVVISATIDGVMVGTVRCTFSSDVALEKPELYEFQAFENLYPGRVMFASKLMVSSSFRHKNVFPSLMLFAFRTALSRNAAVSILDCNHHLVKPFKKFGFVPYKDPAIHPEFGEVNFMSLNNWDLDRLQAIESPFSSVLKAFLAKTEDFGLQQSV